MSLDQILTKLVSKSIEQDFWSACKKDRHGNPILIRNYMMRVFAFVTLPMGIAVLFICIFSPDSYVLEDIDPENIPVVMYSVSIFLIMFSSLLLRRKVTLKKDALVVRGLFFKRSVSIDELRMAALRQPPKRAGLGYVAFATDTKDIRVMYQNAVGGVVFIKLLCKRIHSPLPQGFSSLQQNATLLK